MRGLTNVISVGEHLSPMVFLKLTSEFTLALSNTNVCCVKLCLQPMEASNVTCLLTVRSGHSCVHIARRLLRPQWTVKSIWKHIGKVSFSKHIFISLALLTILLWFLKVDLCNQIYMSSHFYIRYWTPSPLLLFRSLHKVVLKNRMTVILVSLDHR